MRELCVFIRDIEDYLYIQEIIILLENVNVNVLIQLNDVVVIIADIRCITRVRS